ncbi:MAG: hypothetical protein NC097_03630 [Clostridium sp.]|nr:hypothetical protein [Prevotella sp.]MCM1428868.1 hypothetical protein [Clostridium sp.]MCM1475247.1 hypothetical protein [Muribaculaceae bacterium]
MIGKFFLSAAFVLTAAMTPAYAEAGSPTEPDNMVKVETTITAVTVAELDISDKRVSKSTSWTLKAVSPTSLEQRKANLIVELCREVEADVLVDPQFTFSKRIFGGGKLTVSGYPARYKNFRTMSPQEVEAFITTPEYQTGKVVFINK